MAPLRGAQVEPLNGINMPIFLDGGALTYQELGTGAKPLGPVPTQERHSTIGRRTPIA